MPSTSRCSDTPRLFDLGRAIARPRSDTWWNSRTCASWVSWVSELCTGEGCSTEQDITDVGRCGRGVHTQNGTVLTELGVARRRRANAARAASGVDVTRSPRRLGCGGCCCGAPAAVGVTGWSGFAGWL